MSIETKSIYVGGPSDGRLEEGEVYDKVREVIFANPPPYIDNKREFHRGYYRRVKVVEGLAVFEWDESSVI